MELQKWKIFQHLDPTFAANVKSAYLVGICSVVDSSADDDEDTESVSAISMGDELENSLYSGGVMIMSNDDVYFITSSVFVISSPGIEDEMVKERLLPLVPTKIDGLRGKQIRAINSGQNHTVILTVEGRIYQWGYFHVGRRQNIEFESEFVAGDGIEKKRAIQIACGQDHNVALTSEGDVYAWGSNRSGQLGTGGETYETRPMKISGLNGFDTKISLVACTGWTSFALDQDGTVWSWGDHEDGALGYKSSEPQKIPRKITTLKNIKTVAAGNTHVLALSNERELYFWGQHAKEGRTRTPKKIEIPNIAFIGATRGCTISAFQTAKRKVYFWGFAYGRDMPDPSPTKFSTMAELFASLDSPVMFEPLLLDQKQLIAEKLKLSLDDRDTADVSFRVEGKAIHAHRLVLKSRSDHFKRIFDSNWEESGEKELDIQEFSYRGLHAFLYYLYTDRIDPALWTAEDGIELLRLSDYYGEAGLKRRCMRRLKMLITIDKVSKAYAVSCQHNANDLRELALHFMIPYLSNVVKTDEFRMMPDDLKGRLFQELANKDVFDGLKRRRKTLVN